MTDSAKIIAELQLAISAFEKGLALFENGNYETIPAGQEAEVKKILPRMQSAHESRSEA